jgi:hypothetical protein
MALWGFRRESTQVASGANTVAGIVKGYRPLPQASGGDHSDNAGVQIANKRNVIATQVGWVRRQNKADVHGNRRQIDEVLVAAAPGAGDGFFYNSNTHLGNADIVEVYVKLNANGVISANVSSNLYVVFNMPVHKRPSGNLMSISIANTISGNHALARIAAASAARANVANNVMVFTLPKLQAGAAASGLNYATYHVNAQSISVTGNPIYNPDFGVTVTANLVITGAVANNLSNQSGARITNFVVSKNGLPVV